MDQALGRVFEPIEPEFPPEAVQRRAAFVEPLLTAEAFSAAISAALIYAGRLRRDRELAAEHALRQHDAIERRFVDET